MDDTIKRYSEILETAVVAAKKAGDYLIHRQKDIKKLDVMKKGPYDIVTEADKESEVIIRQTIISRYPKHAILGEEGGFSGEERDDYWAIDPLDGTVNYAHGYPFFCVSIGFIENGASVVGVVFDPTHDGLFTAHIGSGAYLNGKRIYVDEKTKLRDSIVATGFPHDSKGCIDAYLESFRGILEKSQGVRRMGSAALDLCSVARGRAGGFWEPNLKRWDFAAGVLLVVEAGGMVSDFTGGQKYTDDGDIIAASPTVYKEILPIIKKSFYNKEKK